MLPAAIKRAMQHFHTDSMTIDLQVGLLVTGVYIPG